MTTIKALIEFLTDGAIPDEKLEEKKEYKEMAQEFVETIPIHEGNDPVAAMNLGHRMAQLGDAIKKAIEPEAIAVLSKIEDAKTMEILGAKATLKVSTQYKITDTPEILKYREEIENIQSKNKKHFEAVEQATIDITSLNKQIKTVQDKLVEKKSPFVKKTGEKKQISFKY